MMSSRERSSWPSQSATSGCRSTRLCRQAVELETSKDERSDCLQFDALARGVGIDLEGVVGNESADRAPGGKSQLATRACHDRFIFQLFRDDEFGAAAMTALEPPSDTFRHASTPRPVVRILATAWPTARWPRQRASVG